MEKALLVTSLLILSASLANGYSTDCAVGPGYWCKSLKNAEECGAIRHCTDTLWRSDHEQALTDSSMSCKWCQKILVNAHNGIQNVVDNEDSMISSLAGVCKLFPSSDFSSKCTNIIDKYGTAVSSLIKNKRYATICRLMNVCVSESTTEKPPVIVGQHRCTWGPAYWCSSLSNSRECNSVAHCSNKVWSQQAISKKPNDNICQYCEYVIGKLRTFILNNTAEINIEKWLSDACSMLQNKELIDKCVETMSKYAEEIVVLIKNNIDPGVICHLGQMCSDATIVVRTQVKEHQSKENEVSSVDEQTQMLCNIIVRATYELRVNQQKSGNEIQTFLKADCQHLSTPELIRKCEDLVDQRGKDIYTDVTNNKALSEICHYPPTSVDSTAVPSVAQTHCNLCTFVLTTTKSMVNAKYSDDQVLAYINEHLCSQLTGEIKTNCEYALESNDKELIDGFQKGKQPILLCTYFQVCLDEVIKETSPVQKDEMRSFLQDNICDHLGPFENACHALIEKDATRLLKTIVNDIDGDVLCQVFGICPTKMSYLDNLAIKDDTNKCKRCIDDFTRRKHIAEKLLNHSAEFLHHFCGQLPQKDECMKSVDESINKLVEFIRSLDPHEICVELKVCDQASLEKIQPLEISSSDNIMTQQMIIYIKNDICTKLGPLSAFCNNLMDSEGTNLFAMTTKTVCSHKICSILDICPKTTSFDNCNDKCECCVSKIENYQVRLASFLHTMVTTANVLCTRMSDYADCLQIVTNFESDVNRIISRFDAKQTCQSLTHCATETSEECDINGDKCTCCQNQFNNRQENFRTVVNEGTEILLALCTEDKCRSLLQSNQQEILNQITTINSLTHCQRSGMCTSSTEQRSIPFLTDLLKNTDPTIQSVNNPCSNFENSKAVCEHLLVSKQSTRYMKVYMALLKDDVNYIDQDLRAQPTSTCDACKNAVQSSKDFWNNALESARNALLQVCDRCPSKDQCRQYINQRFDNLKTYVDKINPEQFCQSIRLCSTAVAATDTCSKCINRLELRKDAALQAVDRLAGYFNDKCQQYGQKQCQAYVKEVHDSIQKSIEGFDPKETCSAIGFCGSTDNEEEMNFDEREVFVQNDIVENICSKLGPFETLCKSVIQGDTKQIQELKLNYDIKDVMKIGKEDITHELLEAEDSDQESHDKCRCCIRRVILRKRRVRFIGDAIFFSLIRSCHRCPAKQQCRRHWLMAKARFDCHISRINPKRVCTHFGFCNDTSVYNDIEDTPENCDETIPLEVSETQQIASNSTCVLCEYVMNILSNYINSQSTEEEIEQNLQKICNQIPSVLQTQCHEYVDNYGPSIIATLIHEFDLSTICHKLNLCTNQMKIDVTHVIKADTATCGVCNYMSTYLYSALQRDSNDLYRQHALASVCSYLPDEQSAKCQTILQLFSPYIHQLELNPKNSFCKQLTICQIPMADLKPAILLNKKEEKTSEIKIVKPLEITSLIDGNSHSTPQCTLCQYVISYLDAIMKNNKSEQAFEEALKKVCSILPSKERTQCDEFVKTYGPTLAQLIAEMADPKTICEYLNMCPTSSVEKPKLPTVNVDEQTPYTCTICQFIVSRMKHFTGIQQEKDQVLTSIKDSCNLFNADNLKTECKNFLDQHGSYFLQIISNDILPRSACQNIGTCTDTYRPLRT